MKKTVAMILAGGRGKRMDILCYGRSKPVLPFAGRWRVIDFSLSNCIHSGISDMAALIDHQRQYTAEYLKEWCMVNTGGNGLHILEPKSGSYKGTSDAVYQNLDYLRDCGPEAVLVLAGDHVYKMDYRKMLAFHRQMEADITVGVVTVPIQQAHRFGLVTTDAEGRIIDFVEKPHSPASNLASMGIYVFKTEVLVEHLLEDSAQPASPHDFGYALIPRMVKWNKVFAYKFDGYWRDIGTIETYYEANMELIRPQPSLSLNSGWPIFTGEKVLPLTELSDTVSVKHSIVSRGCIIRGRVENSILSPGVVVEEQAVVRNSIIMANTIIGRHSVVDRCILDEGVNVGKFCYIGFGAGHILSLSDITVLGRDTIVPPGTAVGRNRRVEPGTKLLAGIRS
jgi:glucose-1-phosphate adenylyltransferase